MAFDLATAKPVGEGGFDLATAKPVGEQPSGLPKAVDYNPGVGVGEMGLSLGTGAFGQIAGGFSGLGTIATNALGLTNTPPGERVQQVANALTYEPRTQAGKALTGGIAMPFEWLAKGAEKAGGAVTDVMSAGSPRFPISPEAAAGAGTVANTAIQAIPQLLGRGARALPGESAAAIAERAKTQALNAPVDKGIAAAREANLAITPTQAEGGVIARTLEGVSGAPKLEKSFSKKNAPTINDLIRRDVGLPEDVPLSREALIQARAEAGQAYEAVKNIGRVETDAKYKADLHEITASYDTAAKDFAHRSENPFKKTLDGLNKESFDAASAVEEVKLLRRDADKAYRQGDPGLGRAYKQAAQALDDQLDRHLGRLENAGNAETSAAITAYRAARERIAKTYAAESALNDTTGNINADVYALMLKNKKPLTGEALTVAKFAQQFPTSARRVEKTGNTGATYFDLLLPLMSKEALLFGARPIARSLMGTNIAQDFIASPRTYGKPTIRRLQDLISEISAEQGAVGTAAGQRQ